MQNKQKLIGDIATKVFILLFTQRSTNYLLRFHFGYTHYYTGMVQRIQISLKLNKNISIIGFRHGIG